jgi:4-hydroxy-4-methyl-2-oxoglutarate aldolase
MTCTADASTVFGKIGFRFRTEIERADAGIIEEMKKYPTPNIADAMNRFRVMDPGIKAVNEGDFVAGPAITVMCASGDNLMFHKAMALAKPGDVLVGNYFGAYNTAGFGGLMGRSAKRVGIAGLIVDGAVRDADDFKELGLPVYSRTVTASGCFKNGPGEVNYPISCGGVVVMPGDIVIASRDGIVVVPRADAEYVLAETKAVFEREAKRIREIGEGVLFKPDIDNTLRAKKIIP